MSVGSQFRVVLSSSVLTLPLAVLGGAQFNGGLDYFITLRSSSLSHGVTFAPSFVDARRMLKELNASIQGEIEMSIPSDYSKVLVTWENSRWEGLNAAGIPTPGVIDIPFAPKLRVDYGFSDVDGKFVRDRSLIQVEELSASSANANKPTEVRIDWSKQQGSSNAKIKFDIEEDRELLFKELVSRIPVSAIRGAFAVGNSDRYAVVGGTVTARVELFKDASDTRPVETKSEVFPISVHYFLEDDIQITPVQGHENLFFGKVSLPSDKGYWLEMKPQNQTLSNMYVDNSSYVLEAVGGGSNDLTIADVVKRSGSLAAFEINGAPNIIKEPTFSCGNNSGDATKAYSGYLAQSMESGYEALIPIYIGKEHTKFVTKYSAGYSSYTLIVGGKIFVSRNVPSGLYRSTCNIDIMMG